MNQHPMQDGWVATYLNLNLVVNYVVTICMGLPSLPRIHQVPFYLVTHNLRTFRLNMKTNLTSKAQFEDLVWFQAYMSYTPRL